MLIDENGVEFADYTALEASGFETDTPNYVSDPEVRADAIELFVDCKGAIGPAMQRRVGQDHYD